MMLSTVRTGQHPLPACILRPHLEADPPPPAAGQPCQLLCADRAGRPRQHADAVVHRQGLAGHPGQLGGGPEEGDDQPAATARQADLRGEEVAAPDGGHHRRIHDLSCASVLLLSGVSYWIKAKLLFLHSIP